MRIEKWSDAIDLKNVFRMGNSLLHQYGKWQMWIYILPLICLFQFVIWGRSGQTTPSVFAPCGLRIKVYCESFCWKVGQVSTPHTHTHKKKSMWPWLRDVIILEWRWKNPFNKVKDGICPLIQYSEVGVYPVLLAFPMGLGFEYSSVRWEVDG